MSTRDELHQRASGGAIGAVRIGTGLLWLANLHWKVPGDFGETSGGGLYKYIAAGADNAPLAPFRWALRELVLPNFSFFGWFTLLSETVLAALLLVGYRTRLVALTGAAMTVPIMLSVIYYPRADEWAWSYLMMIGLHVVLWAIAAGDHAGADGVLSGSPERARRAVRAIGVVGAIIGAVGLFVARSIDFAGKKAALLGSDAGFVTEGKLVRRWELKFLWFNPLWAVLTMVFAALLIIGSRQLIAAWAGVAGFALMAVAVLVQRTFDYVRDDGAVQVVSTGSNAAVWGGLALAGALFVRRTRSSTATTAIE